MNDDRQWQHKIGNLCIFILIWKPNDICMTEGDYLAERDISITRIVELWWFVQDGFLRNIVPAIELSFLIINEVCTHL